MNLEKMFEMQAELDNRIIREKGLEGQDLLPGLILALQVELAECANEWRGFKFWSNNQQPRTCIINKEGETSRDYYKNPLLEEYVDCLHFILSIGNRIEYSQNNDVSQLTKNILAISGVHAFLALYHEINNFYSEHEHVRGRHIFYERIFRSFIELGDFLGFTPEEIEAAYMEKNEVNHKRQQEGY